MRTPTAYNVLGSICQKRSTPLIPTYDNFGSFTLHCVTLHFTAPYHITSHSIALQQCSNCSRNCLAGVLGSEDHHIEKAGVLGSEDHIEKAGVLGSEDHIEKAGVLGSKDHIEKAGVLGSEDHIEKAGVLGSEDHIEKAGVLESLEDHIEESGVLGSEDHIEKSGVI